MQNIRRRLTYANVVSTLALIVAVGGGTTAIAISGKVGAKDLAKVKVREAVAPVSVAQGEISVKCAKGERLIGGGGSAGRAPGAAVARSISNGNGWEVEASAIGGPGSSVTPVAQALCLKK